MDGFGFTGTMEKLGVGAPAADRRESKGFLTRSSPLVPAQREYAQKMLGEIHQQFIEVVRTGGALGSRSRPSYSAGWCGPARAASTSG